MLCNQFAVELIELLLLCTSQQPFSESPAKEITFLSVLNQSVGKYVSAAPGIKEDSIFVFFSLVFSFYACFPFIQVMGEQSGHLSVSKARCKRCQCYGSYPITGVTTFHFMV